MIAAYIQRADGLYRQWLTAATAPAIGTPRERILALFDALDEQVQPQRCRGCPFLMALAEFPDPKLPAHAGAVATKAWVRGQLGELAAALEVSDPDALADQLAVVMEGVYASAQALGGRRPCAAGRSARRDADGRCAPPPFFFRLPTGCQAVLSSVTASRRTRSSSAAAAS